MLRHSKSDDTTRKMRNANLTEFGRLRDPIRTDHYPALSDDVTDIRRVWYDRFKDLWTRLEPHLHENDKRIFVLLVNKMVQSKQKPSSSEQLLPGQDGEISVNYRKNYVFQGYSVQLQWIPFIMARSMFGFSAVSEVSGGKTFAKFKKYWHADDYETDMLPKNWSHRRDIEKNLPGQKDIVVASQADSPATDLAAPTTAGQEPAVVPEKRKGSMIEDEVKRRKQSVCPVPATPDAHMNACAAQYGNPRNTFIAQVGFYGEELLRNREQIASVADESRREIERLKADFEAKIDKLRGELVAGMARAHGPVEAKTVEAAELRAEKQELHDRCQMAETRNQETEAWVQEVERRVRKIETRLQAVETRSQEIDIQVDAMDKAAVEGFRAIVAQLPGARIYAPPLPDKAPRS